MTGSRADTIFIRAKDITLIVSILTVVGCLYAMAMKPAQWDQTVKDVNEMKPLVTQHGQQLATINAQYANIKDELQAINRKMGR